MTVSIRHPHNLHSSTLSHLSLTSLKNILSLARFILLTSPYSVYIPNHFFSSLWENPFCSRSKAILFIGFPLPHFPPSPPTSCSKHFKPFGSLISHNVPTRMPFACTALSLYPEFPPYGPPLFKQQDPQNKNKNKNKSKQTNKNCLSSNCAQAPLSP